MKRKRTSRKKIAALLAAACVAGNMPYAQVRVSAKGQAEETSEPVSEDYDAQAVSEGAYTDESGVVFTYQEYADGTAHICGIDEYRGKQLAVPAQIDGLRVTGIRSRTAGEVESLAIPETITYIGDLAFSSLSIGTLYYDASEARTGENGAVFGSARIGSLVLGGNVRSIEGPVFKNAVFLQDSLTVSVPVIGKEAFQFAEFRALTLTDSVEEIHEDAFGFSKIQELHYDTNAAHIMKNQLGAVFSSASIYALEIGGSVKELPAYAFHWADMCFDRLTLQVEKVGDYAFGSAWKEGKGHTLSLTVADSVKYMGLGAFQHCQIGELELDASVETGNAYHVNGIFSKARIESLHISDSVDSIPDCMFDNAYLAVDELTLDMEKIGEFAFYGENIQIGKLTVGEHVTSIGCKSFSFCGIDSLSYEAAGAQVPGAEYPEDGPFYGTVLDSVEIGSRVAALPAYLFREAKLDLEELALPDNIESIGDYAVCGNILNPSSIHIGTLAIGGNLKSMGKNAFDSCAIDKAVIHTLEAADGAYAAGRHAPECGHVEIHGGSDYYKYFTQKTDAENITLMCSDFETSYGETYYDGEKGCYVTPVTESCVSCGYKKTGEEYGDAHTVIFLDYNGKEISRQHVRTGQDAAAPEDPERTGWRFTGWDKEYKGVTADLTVTAQYEICRFTVTFVDGETVLSSQEVEYGSDAETPENPARPDEAWGKWKFAGWDGSYTGITEDVTVRALFEKVLNEYEAVFYDADGNVLSSQTVKHGGKAETPQAPEKAADSQYIYIFKGWDADTENITADSSFHPVYEMRDHAGVTSPGAFTVTFMDDEKVLSVQKVESGKDASAPEDPARPDETWGKWKFTGWKGSYQNVTKDETVYAMFDKILNEYEVVFYDADGEILSTQTVKHGEKAKAPQDPEKAADGKYTYVFKGWDADTENITADSSFHPVYETRDHAGVTSPGAFTVTFMDDERVLSVQKVESGKDASAPEDPARPDEAWGKWKFTGWKGSYKNITKDETVYAMFEKVLNEYKVIFYDADEKILSTQTVKHGEKADAPQAPEKAADGKRTYVFKGWDADTENITADTSFHPVYETKADSGASDNASTYTVTFMDGDKVLDVQKVESGKDASAPEDPARPDEAWGKWKFTGWKGSYQNVIKDETVYAMFEKILNEYEVVFYDADGKILSTQTVKHGEKAKAPQAPEKAADGKYTYVFKGWDADTENITADTSFHPVYETKADSGASDNAGTYTVTFMDGDKVLDVQKVESGKDASVPADPARPDEAWGKWQFTGWKGSYQNITKDETVYAMFEKALNEYKVVFYDADGKILSTQTVKHGGEAERPQAPEKAPDARHKYIFKGWDGNTENITSDTRLHPVYETRIRTYTVTFMSGKKALSVQEVEYGASAAAPSDPMKKADGKRTYKFAGWDADFSFITKDITVHALFDVEENGTDGQEQSKDKNKDKDTNKDTNKDANTNKDTDKDKNTDKDTSADTNKDADTNKGAGNSGSGADGKDTKTGGKGRPAGGSTGSGGPGTGQPETGGKKILTENAPSAQKPDAGPESGPADRKKPAQQKGKETEGNRKQKKTDEEKGQENAEDIRATDESDTDGLETEASDDKKNSREDSGGKAWKHTNGYKPLFLLIIGAASAIAVWALLYLRFFRKRRIRGTVVDTDGNPVCGIPVSIAGEETFETCTDGQGSFCFAGLEKGVWKLEASRGGKTCLSMDICAGRQDKEETFRIRSSHCLRVDHAQEKNNYVVDVTL